MISIGNAIKRINGLTDTKDLSSWENDFVRNIVEKSSNGDNTEDLSTKQVEIIMRIHNKHFEG